MSAYLLVLYMAVNCVTDILYLKTKNLWHGIFILIVLFLSLWRNLSLFNLGLTLAATLILGLLLSKVHSIGEGDIKMLVVSSLIVFLDYPLVIFYWTAFLEVIFYIVFSTLAITLLICVSIILRFFTSGTPFGYNKLIFRKYELTTELVFPFKFKLKWSIPGAPNVLFATLFLLIFYKSIS